MAMVHDSAEARRAIDPAAPERPADRRQDAKANREHHRRQQERPGRRHDERRRATTEAHTRIGLGPIAALPMMIRVHAFVEERQDEQGHADQHVPRKRRPGRHGGDVRDLVMNSTAR
jgi:hypothetical protein